MFLDDDSIYLGYVKAYRADPDESEQDFVLGQVKRVDEHLQILNEIDGLGVYLNTRNVKRIEYYKGVTESRGKRSK